MPFSKLSKLTKTHPGLPRLSGQHGTSLHDRQEYARGLSAIRLRDQRPLLTHIRYLDPRLCRRPSLRRLQYLQPPALPARNLELRYRMGAFHERVGDLQNCRVGKGFGRASTHFDRKLDLDVQPMGLLC